MGSPAWCVPVDLSMDTRIQLMIEIAILGFLFAGVFAFGNGNESGIDKKAKYLTRASMIYRR